MFQHLLHINAPLSLATPVSLRSMGKWCTHFQAPPARLLGAFFSCSSNASRLFRRSRV